MLCSVYMELVNRYSRIGTLYFDGDKLKDWSAISQQTMALFERIRTVGKGKLNSCMYKCVNAS